MSESPSESQRPRQPPPGVPQDPGPDILPPTLAAEARRLNQMLELERARAAARRAAEAAAAAAAAASSADASDSGNPQEG